MSFISYLPLPKGYILCYNRDEFFLKATNQLVMNSFDGSNESRRQILFVEDPIAKGTWLACDNAGNTVALLNGVEKGPPNNKDKIKKSRGQLVTELLRYGDPISFFEFFDLKSFAAFTAIVCYQGFLFEAQWDTFTLRLTKKDEREIQTWSSPLLFNQMEAQQRANWFYLGIAQLEYYTPDIVRAIQLLAGSGHESIGLLRQHNTKYRTLSVSSVFVQAKSVEFSHCNLENMQLRTEKLVRLK